MKNLDAKTRIFIVIIGFMFIFAFILIVGFILSNIDSKNKLQGYAIATSFITIFATFGGAYLGAKISGENASKLAKKESMINDLNKTKEYNYKILDRFNSKELKRKIDYIGIKNDLENVFDVNNFVFNFFGLKSEYEYFMKNNDFDNAFPLISYDFNDLEKNISVLAEELWKYNEKSNEYLRRLINEYGYKDYVIQGYGSALLFYKHNDNACVVVKKDNEEIKIQLEIKEMQNIFTNKEIEELNIYINDFKKYWLGFKFKTKDDIRDFIAKYYGNYE